ncbi:hypothetical protein HaLaN_30154, partial [Haematococcus lacustris]
AQCPSSCGPAAAGPRPQQAHGQQHAACPAEQAGAQWQRGGRGHRHGAAGRCNGPARVQGPAAGGGALRVDRTQRTHPAALTAGLQAFEHHTSMRRFGIQTRITVMCTLPDHTEAGINSQTGRDIPNNALVGSMGLYHP